MRRGIPFLLLLFLQLFQPNQNLDKLIQELDLRVATILKELQIILFNLVNFFITLICIFSFLRNILFCIIIILLFNDIFFLDDLETLLLVELSNEMAIVFEYFDGFPGSFFEREVPPFSEVEHLAAEDLPVDEELNFVGRAIVHS